MRFCLPSMRATLDNGESGAILKLPTGADLKPDLASLLRDLTSPADPGPYEQDSSPENVLTEQPVGSYFTAIRAPGNSEKRTESHAMTADVIIPGAALVGAPACARDPWLSRSVGVDAVIMLEVLRSEAQLIIFRTTNGGYGTKSGEVLCTEETLLEPISMYGQQKVEDELMRASLKTGSTVRPRLLPEADDHKTAGSVQWP